MSQVRFFKLTTAARTAGTPPDSSYVWDEDEEALYRGDGVTVGGVLVAGGGGGGVSDHGALTGLADDDHTQYHNDARGDARYSPLAHEHSGVYTTPAEAAAAAPVQSVAGRTGVVVLAQADVSGTVPTTRIVTAGAGLTGGGALSADITLNVGAGTGLTVAADTVSVAYGSAADTACQGNDPRLSDARTPTAHTHPVAQISDAGTVGAAVVQAETVAAAQQAMDVELGVNVLAYMPTASQAEMEAGTEPALRAMSPLRVAQAAEALADRYHSGTSFPVSPVSGQLFNRTDRGVLYSWSSTAWVPIQAFGDLTVYADPAGNGDAFDSAASGGATTIAAALAQIPSSVAGDLTVNVRGDFSAENVSLPSVSVGAGKLKRFNGELGLITTLTANGALTQYVAGTSGTPETQNVSETLTASAYKDHFITDKAGNYQAIWDNTTSALQFVCGFEQGLKNDFDPQVNPTTGHDFTGGESISVYKPSALIKKLTITVAGSGWRVQKIQGTQLTGTGCGSVELAACVFKSATTPNLNWAQAASGFAKCVHFNHTSVGFSAIDYAYLRGANVSFRGNSSAYGALSIQGNTSVVPLGFAVQASSAARSMLIRSGAAVSSANVPGYANFFWNPVSGGGVAVEVHSSGGLVDVADTHHVVQSATIDATSFGYRK